MTTQQSPASNPERILITGASRGIGAATALRLAREGRELLLAARDVRALERVAEQASELGSSVQTYALELTDEEACNRWASSLPPTLNAVVHNAGVATLGRIADLSDADWSRQWAVNVAAPVRITRALLPRLRTSRGTVVFVNSTAGLTARASWGGYAASKFALKAVADALRDEEKGVIRVSSVYPSRTDTDMQVSVRAQEGGPYQADAYLTPQVVADAIAFAIEAPVGASVDELRVQPC